MTPLRDKTGREIEAGDILKVYHFTAALRRKKHFMYKQAIGVVSLGLREPKDFLKISHLDMDDADYYHQILDGRTLTDYEIIQGRGDVEARPKKLE